MTPKEILEKLQPFDEIVFTGGKKRNVATMLDNYDKQRPGDFVKRYADYLIDGNDIKRQGFVIGTIYRVVIK